MFEFLSLVGLVLATNALGMFSPGPDMLLLLRDALGPRQAVALWTVAGISTGIAVHLSLSLLGLSGLALQDPHIFALFLALAALYLLWLGGRGLFANWRAPVSEAGAEIEPQKPVVAEQGGLAISRLAAFRDGFFTNILNVKAGAFYVSLFALVVGPDVSVPARVAIGLVCLLECVLLWSLFVILLRRGLAGRFTQNSKLQLWIHRTGAALLCVAGLLLLWEAYSNSTYV